MIVLIVRVEGAPAAILALHAIDPLGRAVDGGAIARGVMAMHGERHHRRVVDIGISRVCVLEGPAAGAQVGPPLRPVAFHIQDLALNEPVEAARRGGICFGATCLQKRVTNETRVPDRRDAGLAIGPAGLQDQQLLE